MAQREERRTYLRLRTAREEVMSKARVCSRLHAQSMEDISRAAQGEHSAYYGGHVLLGHAVFVNRGAIDEIVHDANGGLLRLAKIHPSSNRSRRHHPRYMAHMEKWSAMPGPRRASITSLDVEADYAARGRQEGEKAQTDAANPKKVMSDE